MMIILFLCFFYSLTSTSIYGMQDNCHFYRANNLFFEPRLERNWLSTVEISVGKGSTRTSSDSNGCTTPLLDIHGTSALQFLGAGIHFSDPYNPYDNLLQELSTLSSPLCNGSVSFFGAFTIIEANVLYVQNFMSGFFIQAHLPVRTLQLREILYKDCSQSLITKHQSWLALLNQLPEILDQYHIQIKPTQNTACGDFSAHIGYTMSYQNNPVLDFIDSTLRIGMIAPTGSRQNLINPFLPNRLQWTLGYNCSWRRGTWHL